MTRDRPPPPSREARRRRANDLLAMGATVGAIGALGALAGATCPLCVVAAPALLGAGAVERLRARRRRLTSESDAPPLPAVPCEKLDSE